MAITEEFSKLVIAYQDEIITETRRSMEEDLGREGKRRLIDNYVRDFESRGIIPAHLNHVQFNRTVVGFLYDENFCCNIEMGCDGIDNHIIDLELALFRVYERHFDCKNTAVIG